MDEYAKARTQLDSALDYFIETCRDMKMTESEINQHIEDAINNAKDM